MNSVHRQMLRWTVLLTLQLIGVVDSGLNEKMLLNKLGLTTNGSYNKLERPVINESDPMVVQFGLTLQQIIDVNEKNQILTTNIWLNMNWNDYNLRWNESEFGGIKSIRVPAGLLWRPDILMYNSADEDIDSTFPTNVVVSSNGGCLWVPPGLFFSTCKIDITWFPFDDQECQMKFGSWTYDSAGIDLQLMAETGDISSFIPNGEWELIGVPAQRNTLSYECCPEQYVDITFSVHIRRRTLYYGFNLIIPCVLISSMALLAFTLPPDAGEKISLGVTILLSLTVFLLLVAETMPPTSDAVPLIGMYFACIMIMCSLSVVFTVLVLNYHHRSPDTHDMPWLVKVGVCYYLARVLRMQRSARFVLTRQRSKRSSSSRKDIELREKRIRVKPLASIADNSNDSPLLGHPNHRADIWRGHHPHPRPHPHGPPSNFVQKHLPPPVNLLLLDRPSPGTTAAALGGGQTLPPSPPPTSNNELQGVAADDPLGDSRCSVLREILAELQKINAKAAKDEEALESCNDWKFAAMVIDRFCLFVFTTSTVISTFAILLSAPYFSLK